MTDPALEWSSFFSTAELAALDLGFALPELAIADPNETLLLNSYDGNPASAWTGCTIDPEHVPPIAFRHDYFSVGRGTNEKPRRLLLHELSHIAGNPGHQFAFAVTLKVIFLRHFRHGGGEPFELRRYDVHQDHRPVDEVMHFSNVAAERFFDDKRSVFELVPELWRIQYKADREGLAAAMPRPRRRWLSF